jgi:hypothetical protein
MNNAVVTREMLVDLNISLGSTDMYSTVKKAAPVDDLFSAYTPKETLEEGQKLAWALDAISSDVPRGIGRIDLDDEPTDYWLGVIWAVASLGWRLGKGFAKTWSKDGSDRYTDEGFEAAWNAYDPNHTKPIGIGSVYKLAEKLKGKNTETSITETAKAESTKSQTVHSPLAFLNGFSLTGSSEQMKKQMLDDVFVMEGLAILGQWTTLYAAPNTGKTLLTLWLLQEQIKGGIIEGSKVYYVNADDTFTGAVHKIELAEQWGMQILVPGHNDFKARFVPEIMEKLAEAGEARGVVLVLDTLKKFADLMDKTAASAFGATAREFVSAGGTLICLAHTNKHKDAEGKGIYSGTSDIVDDSDCMFVIDKLSAEGGDISKVHTVELTNKKARGDVSSSAMYTYVRRTGEPYSALVDSVKRIESTDAETVKKTAERNRLLEQNDEIIKAITSSIGQGVTAKNELINSAVAETATSKPKVKAVLERWTGSDYGDGHRWAYKAGDHNRFSYSLTTPPSNS